MKKNLKYIIPIIIINILLILNIINFNISFISFFSLIILAISSLYFTTILTTKITLSLHSNFLSFFYKPNISEKIENIINDIYNIEQDIFIYIFTLLYIPLHIFIYLIYSFKNYTYFYLLIISSLIFFLYKYKRKINYTFSCDDYFKGINNITLALKEEKEEKELKYQYNNYLNKRRKMIIITSIIYLVILSLISLSNKIFLSTYILPLIFIIYKREELNKAYGYIKNYKKAYHKNKNKLILDFNNYITLKNISIHNFKNFSITFPKNHICIIYGPNMSGKSTILDVLAQRINVNKGEILVDNERLINKSFDLNYMRDEDYLFPNSIKRMFLELNGGTNETRIHFWLKQVNAEYFAYDLQKIILNNGEKLTKEEQSKLKIALNLIKDGKILLFDEPFKYLDTNTIKRITSNLRYLSKTIIITTNDYNHLQFGDIGYIIDDNKLLYMGEFNNIPYDLERKYKI